MFSHFARKELLLFPNADGIRDELFRRLGELCDEISLPDATHVAMRLIGCRLEELEQDILRRRPILVAAEGVQAFHAFYYQRCAIDLSNWDRVSGPKTMRTLARATWGGLAGALALLMWGWQTDSHASRPKEIADIVARSFAGQLSDLQRARELLTTAKAMIR